MSEAKDKIEKAPPRRRLPSGGMTDWIGVDVSKFRPYPLDEVGKFSVVYYLRFADRIKIGTTSDLPERLREIPYDELVAIEPGSHGTEHLRHVEFARHRIATPSAREWFVAAPDLIAHMRNVVATWGDPKRAYVKWVANLEESLTT